MKATGYWIIRGSVVVGRHFPRCRLCKRFQGQKMSDLPPDRYFFGPFFVKCVWRLETANSLETLFLMRTGTS